MLDRTLMLPRTSSAPLIAIAGTIAAGKSTLTGSLASLMGVPAHEERPHESPFRGPPERRAFQAEAWFLSQSARTYAAVAEHGAGAVVERSLQEHVDVFALARRRRGWIHADELEVLRTLRDLVAVALPRPHLLLFAQVDAATAAERIARRGRPEEAGVELAYLELLERLYEEFVAGWDCCPVLAVDSVATDFRQTPDLHGLVSSIKEHVA